MSESSIQPTPDSAVSNAAAAQFVFELGIWQTEATVPEGAHQFCELPFSLVLAPEIAVGSLILIGDALAQYILTQEDTPIEYLMVLDAILKQLQDNIENIATQLTPDLAQQAKEAVDAQDTSAQDS